MHLQPKKIWRAPSWDLVVGEPWKGVWEVQRSWVRQVISFWLCWTQIRGSSVTIFPNLANGREGSREGMPFTLFASVIMMILKRTHFLFGTSFLPSPSFLYFFFLNYFFFFRIILFRPINFWVSAFTYLLYCSVYRINLGKRKFLFYALFPPSTFFFFFFPSYLLASAVRFWWSPFVLYS